MGFLKKWIVLTELKKDLRKKLISMLSFMQIFTLLQNVFLSKFLSIKIYFNLSFTICLIVFCARNAKTDLRY